MAHRIITQVLASGSRIFGRAVSEAYKQAQASQKYAAASAGKEGGASRTFEASGLTTQEAYKILDVAPPKEGKVDMEKVTERFKRLFDSNEPSKGGSFYIQSKILRARQRIEMEANSAAEKQAKVKETQEGWKPKIYKDR